MPYDDTKTIGTTTSTLTGLTGLMIGRMMGRDFKNFYRKPSPTEGA